MIEKETLRYKYETERKTIKELAENAGYSYGKMRQILLDEGITPRCRSEAHRGKLLGDKNPTRRRDVREKISISRRRWEKSEDGKQWRKWVSYHSTGRKASKETRKKQSDKRKGSDNPNYKRPQNITKEWLENEYINNTRSMKSIGNEINVSSRTVQLWLISDGIKTRTVKEANKNNGTQCGEKNPAWKGGISYGPYCNKFNNKLKESIREEFDRKCFICGENENGRKLDIHHVDYNKNTLCNGKEWGLIPLCRSCHTRTNSNRWHWFALLNGYWVTKHVNTINDGLYL